MKVIKSTVFDIDVVAKIHIKAFPNSVSSKMGIRFCKKMMEWFIVNERGCLLHIVDDNNNVAGYVSLIKTTKQGQPGSFTCITQYAIKTVISSLLLKPWLITSPMFKEKRKAIIRNIKYIIYRKEPESIHTSVNKQFEPSIGIVGIGVDPKYQGRGYGSKLIQSAKIQAKELGFLTLQLSVNKYNSQAIKAYRRNGFVDDAIGEEIIMKAPLL